MAQSALNILSAPNNTYSVGLSESNFTVTLNATLTSTNGTAVTNFSRSHANMRRGYVLTSTNTNPFASLNYTNAKAAVASFNSTFNGSTWAYEETSTPPTIANCPTLRKSASSETTTSLSASSTEITFTNPGVYYVWAYTYNITTISSVTNFFYYSTAPLVLNVYPKNYSATGDGEKYYCGLNGVFSEVAPSRWTAQGSSYIYEYYYLDFNGDYQSIMSSTTESLTLLHTDVNDPTAIPNPYVYYKRGYQVGNDTLWQAEGTNFDNLTKIDIYNTPQLHFDAGNSVPQTLFFNSQNDASDFDISVDGSAAAQSVFGYFLPSEAEQFNPQTTSPSLALAYSTAPIYQFDEVPEALTLHHVVAQDASDYLAEGESGVFYYVGYSTCYANDNTKYIELSIPMHKYATPSINPTATFCGSATIADLQTLNVASFDSQYEHQWFVSTDLNTQLSSSTPLVNGTNYVVCYVLSGETVKSAPSNELAVTINSLPIVAVSANHSSICAGATVQLTASGADSYSWSNSETTEIITVIPTTNTTYTVTGTDVNGCVNTDNISITVYALPTVAASATQSSICSGESTSLSVVGASTYSWSNSEITGSITVNPTSSTTYTVTGTDANGCTNTDEVVVTVKDLPSFTFQGNTSICLGQNTDLTILNSPSGVNAINHDWSTGATTATVNVSPLSSTTYSYTGTGENGCYTTQQVTVTVNALPSVNAGSNQTVCSGSSVTLNGSGATTYNWMGSTPNTPSYTFTALTTNTYTLMGFDGNGCSNTDEVTVTVISSPSVSATSNYSSICSSSNTSVTLTAGGANTYSWSNGLNTTTVSVSPSATTTYTVTGTDNNGCSSTAEVTVNVDTQNSGGQVNGTGSYCSGAAVSEIHIAGHGGSIQWQSSTDNTNFQTIIGATGVTYEPGVLTQTTYYRGLVTNGSCTAYSLTGTVNIVSGGWIGAAGTTMINGVQSYDLSNPLNWCGGVPSTPSIPDGVTVYVDGSYEFTDVTIECGGKLVITETGRVKITNVLTNGGVVQVINGGTIKIGSKVDGSCPGIYKYAETFSPSRFWYVGPTTSNTVRTDFGSVASTSNPTGTQMWSWNETANATNGYIAPLYSSGTTLIPGKGYVYRNLGSTTLDVNVTGPYFTNSISHTGLTRTGSGPLAGYHLISNPYTAYLNADDILKQNPGTVNMVSSMWIRSNSSSTGGVSTMVFDTYNSASGLGTGLGWQMAAQNSNATAMNSHAKWIAPMQGFWVRVNNNGPGSVAYNYAMTEVNPAGAGQLRTTSSITALARLNISFGEQKDQIVAALSANASNAFESYDSEKMFTSGVVQLYAPNSGKKLAINTLKNNKSKVSMPLTVECPSVGWYTFDLVELQLENGVVFLEDKVSGEMKDLTTDASYQFYANSGVLQNRFVLHFHLPLTISNVTGPAAIEDLVSESQNATIEIANTGTGNVSVTLDQVDEITKSIVRVCDLNGRVINSFTADGKTFDFQIDNGQGAYIIEVTNGLTVEKKKVFIQ